MLRAITVSSVVTAPADYPAAESPSVEFGYSPTELMFILETTSESAEISADVTNTLLKLDPSFLQSIRVPWAGRKVFVRGTGSAPVRVIALVR